jgi:trimeric autotransporter adhesin
MKKIYCLFLLLVNTYLVAQTPFWQDSFENATTPDVAAGSTRTTSINAGSSLPSTSYFKRSNNTVGDRPEMKITLSEITKSIPGTGSALKNHEPADVNGTGEEWAIDNFRVLETASSQTLSTAPTLTFTSDTGISSDNIATDGDGGAVSISDININITNISDVNGTFATPLSWENTVFYGSGSYTGLTKNIGSSIGTKGMMLKSGDGSEFRLEQFQYLNWGELSSITNTIKGYRNGTEVATQTFEGYNASFIATTITLSSAFQNVDEVRFYISSIGYIPDGSSTNHSINAIKVSSPVLTPEINVQGNSMTILDGDNSPAVIDQTDFGNVNIGSNLVRTFTVQNIGAANLSVSSITSSNPLFTISALSPASPIGASNSSTFTVTFSPTAVGLQTSTITINNNDSDEGTYTFAVHGMTPFTLGFTCANGSIVNYYNGGAGPNVGVEFTNGVASGSSLNATANPIIINIPAGFTSGFSVFGDVLIGYNINVYSELNGSGILLRTQNNGQGFGSITFAGIAKSVVLTRYSGPNNGYDNLTFGATTLGTPLSESNIEINVQGNSTTIVDGDNTPSTADDTDFGSLLVNNNIVKSYTIQNTGSVDLNISSITSSNVKFIVGTLSTPSPILAGGSASFPVTFTPTATGTQNAIITINNDDCDEGVYNFDVKGNALAATTSLSINGTPTSLLGSPTTFTATLNRVSAPAGPLSGQTVSFTITLPNASNQTGSVTTDANGEANYMFTSSLVGIHSVNASFLGNATHTASSSSILSHDVLIPCTPPNYTFIGASNVDATDPSLATNWLNGCVPSMNDSAIIITVNSGKTFKASTPIAGSIINNGTIIGSLNLAGSLTNTGLLNPGN